MGSDPVVGSDPRGGVRPPGWGQTLWWVRPGMGSDRGGVRPGRGQTPGVGSDPGRGQTPGVGSDLGVRSDPRGGVRPLARGQTPPTGADMDIAGKARKLERRISRTVDAAVEEFVGRSATSPIEIVHAVLDRAEAEIQEIGRGRRVFPFNSVRVHVIAGGADKALRARFAAVLDGPPSLSDRVVERLRSAGCTVDKVETDNRVRSTPRPYLAGCRFPHRVPSRRATAAGVRWTERRGGSPSNQTDRHQRDSRSSVPTLSSRDASTSGADPTWSTSDIG